MHMSITVQPFGKTKCGTQVDRIVLENKAGTRVSLLTYGSTIQSFIFDGTDIVLGYDTIDGYENANGSYLGATIGRVCNRIAAGHFELNGKSYTLACNETAKQGHLHGGLVGFDKKVWEFAIVNNTSDPTVAMTLVSPDGEEGYPGTCSVRVEYTLRQDNTLSIVYRATSDADTIVNLTNHSYFNVGGCGTDARRIDMYVNANSFTEVDEHFIPTGNQLSVKDTPFDFRQKKSIGDALNGTHPQLRLAGGVDHNFVLNKWEGNLFSLAAELYSEEKGIQLSCYTDLPGLQIYTANFLHEESGKYGYAWREFQGVCLETQSFPDAINQPMFPSIVLRKGEEYVSHTEYRISKR